MAGSPLYNGENNRPFAINCPDRKISYFIVSFDLGNESYQKILLPDYGEVVIHNLSLSVLGDCLCMIFNRDVWVMKEYRHTKSWSKLFTVSYMQDPNMSYILTKAIYMFEDDQVLFELKVDGDSHRKLIVYDPRINTFKFTNYQNKSIFAPQVCVESLISPS
jgi:F-box interacting protein